MKRSVTAMALLLAVLLPLAQAHCVVMGAPEAPGSARGPMKADHSCCAPAPAASPEHAKPADSCPCLQLPPGTLPQAVLAAPTTPAALFALVATATSALTVAVAEAPAPALDIGSPPLPDDPGAHGLRAPPHSA
jgi:hypothetical protein